MTTRIDRDDCDECGKPLGGPRDSVSIAYPGSFHAGDCAKRGGHRARQLGFFAKEMARLVKMYEQGERACGSSSERGRFAHGAMASVCDLVHRLVPSCANCDGSGVVGTKTGQPGYDERECPECHGKKVRP